MNEAQKEYIRGIVYREVGQYIETAIGLLKNYEQYHKRGNKNG